MRATGTIFVKMDGRQLPARGKFNYKLSGEKRELECNADGSPYTLGKPEPGWIKGSITDYGDIDIAEIRNAYKVTVVLELGNGKTVTASNAVQVDAMEGDSEAGETPVEFRSAQVEEILA